MNRRWLLAIWALAALTTPLQAQTMTGAVSASPPAYDNNSVRPLSLDQTGALRTSAVGSSASTAYAVQRTTGVGTTGVLVSATDTTNRRTVTNTSAFACELVTTLGGAYGTGYPLPIGGSFTFDASGRTTSAIYVACSSAGGTVAVLSY